jgi:hypothetical protein
LIFSSLAIRSRFGQAIKTKTLGTIFDTLLSR